MSDFSWTTILASSFQGLWISLFDFLPKLFGALIVLVIGVLFSLIASRIIRALVTFLRIDNLIARLELEKTLEHAGIKIIPSNIFAWLTKWFILLAFFVASVDILGWKEIVYFLNQVLLYIPNVAVAVAIILIGMFTGSFIGEVVKKIVLTTKMRGAKFFSLLAKWSIIIFATMAGLIQLQVAAQLIQILFTGIIVMFALAGGLAFGLGGREEAGKLLAEWSKNMHSKSSKK